MIIRIKDAKTGKMKVIGMVENGIFFKTVNSQRHKFLKFNAYGIQSSVVEKFGENDVRRVRITESDTGDIYESTKSDWENADSVNLGYGKQQMVPVSAMRKIGFYDQSHQLVKF